MVAFTVLLRATISLIITRPVAGSIQNRPRIGKSRRSPVRTRVSGAVSRYSMTQTSVEVRKAPHGASGFANVSGLRLAERENLNRFWFDGSRNHSARIGVLMLR